MRRHERENGRKLSYLDEQDAYQQSDSESEDAEKDDKVEEDEEIYGWDLFRHYPPKTKSGSSADSTYYDFFLQLVKTLTYIVLFIFVVGGGVVSKATILLATSQIEKKGTVAFCEYNEIENRPGMRNLMATIPENGRITWYWCIILGFSVAEIIALLNFVHHVLFKKIKSPKPMILFFHCLLEMLHAVAMAVLFLVVFPQLDSLQSVAISSCTCLVPAFFGLLSRNRQQEGSRNFFLFMLVGDCLALISQISGILLLPYLIKADNVARWFMPWVLIISSCRWWPNYISSKSKIGFVKFLSKMKDDLELSRGINQGITALCRILVFLITSIIIISWKGIDIEQFLNNFPGNVKYNLTLSLENQGIDYTYMENVGISSTNSYIPLLVFLVHALASFITYSSGKFASKTLMQRFGFAFPISLVLPATIATIFVLSNFHEKDSCAFHYFLPDHLFFTMPQRFQEFSDLFIYWERWLWIPWLISQFWITMHIWTPYCERLAITDRIFAVPSYDSLIIDQSLMLNRRKDDAPENPADIKGFRPDETSAYSTIHSESLSSVIKPGDRVTRIYACATMWHEDHDEIMQFLSSILRLDLCQSAMRFTQKRYRVQIDDYFELETHIFFDDAFECLHGCVGACSHDEDDTQVNCYVKSLIECMRISVERLRMLASPPMKYPAPYGGRLEWKLPGQTKLIVHLKDKNKIRHRKRWSQVMYMYYLLGYRLMDRSIHRDRKEVIAENTYILTLDGDIDFRPSAVKVLLHLMKRDKSLGAACGRIHPVGSGPMVWFQKFEYAIGHWLQKSTEHMIGSVLCSPGCFSLFRAKALMEDNVMRKYATKSEDAIHYVQYDQGEDRWLCTLILQSGYKVEYSAASDSFTHAPETFNEFYNQRRRWIPSTIANIFDVLASGKEIRKNNENISRLYIAYHWILMGSTVLGPGTIFLMLVGAFVTAFRIDNWSSFYYNLIPIAIFVIICFACKPNLQLLVAAIISAVYGLVMVVVLVGIMIQIAEDGWTAPSTILFFVVFGQLCVTGLFHPKEWGCLICVLIYYITVPSMYLLLIIFSLFSVNNVTWGTRETKPVITNENDPQINNDSQTNSIISSGNNGGTDNGKREEKGVIDFSFAGFFRCILCTTNQISDEERKLDIISESLNRIGSRLDAFERNTDGNGSQSTQPIHEIQVEKSKDIIDQDSEDFDIVTENISNNSNNNQGENKLGNFLVSPTWLQDPEIAKGGIEFLSHEEEVFWNRLIGKYLYPLDEDKKKLADIAEKLKSLRNEYLFKFFMINALFVFIVFLMQLKKDILHIKWPFGITYKISFIKETVEVHIEKNYLQLEPIGCLFIVGFVVILFIQFVAMIFHRFETFAHILANTNLKCPQCTSKNTSAELLLDDHVKDLVDGLQKLAEENCDPVMPKGKTSIAVSPGKRNTVHHLIENNDKRTRIPSNFDTVFRKNLRESSANSRLTSTGIPHRVFEAFERRRTTFVAQHKRSQLQKSNPDNIYQSPDADLGTNYDQVDSPKIEQIFTYENPAFIPEENEEMEPTLSSRRSQIKFNNMDVIP